MKRFLITLGLLFGILFFSTGCEEGGKTKHPAREEPTLHFDGEGEFDLSKYLFPEQNQTNIYEQKVYVNSEGEKKYDSLEANKSNYNLKFVKDDKNIEEYYGRNSARELSKVYDVQDDRIVVNDRQEDENITIVKFADMNELVIQHTAKSEEDENTKESTMECRIVQSLEERLGYPNVLRLSCTVSENYEIVFRGKRGETKMHGSLELYLAKDIGMVESIRDVCEKTYFSGTLVESECMKTEKTLTQYTD